MILLYIQRILNNLKLHKLSKEPMEVYRLELNGSEGKNIELQKRYKYYNYLYWSSWRNLPFWLPVP